MEPLSLQLTFLSILLILSALIYRNFKKSGNKRLTIIILGFPALIALFFFAYSLIFHEAGNISHGDDILFFNCLSIFSLIILTTYYVVNDIDNKTSTFLMFMIGIMLFVPFAGSLINIYIVIQNYTEYFEPINMDIMKKSASWIMTNIILATIATFIVGSIATLLKPKNK